MIEKVHIQNFKTLKDLTFPCTRMNLFIGDTNTGKTNLLEALTLLSRGSLKDNMFDQRLIRYEKPEDLFPLKDLSEPMVVDIGELRLGMLYNHGMFNIEVTKRKSPKGKPMLVAQVALDVNGRFHNNPVFQYDTHVRRYHYLPDHPFGPNSMKELEPAYGANLPGLLAANKVLRSRLSNILKQRGVRLEVSLTENTIRLSLESDENLVVPLPYRSISDTLKRYMFIYAMLETVHGYSILLDEPEQNTFPFYTKHMAEMMALDKTNQYFITTHNEYLFRSVVEKTPARELSVFITSNDEDGQTMLTAVKGKRLAELLDVDVFFNLHRFVAA